MKNKKFKIALLTFAALMFGSSSVLLGSRIYDSLHRDEIVMAVAEGEEETFECSVKIEKPEHGKIVADIDKGHVGDIVTLNVDPNLGYLVSSISVNDVALIESEDTKGVYSFALVEGENVVKSAFVVDEELFGTFSTMYKQATEKDWTNLFTVENVIVLVKWVLDGGILLVMVRYFIRDKRLAAKLEKGVNETLEKIIPDTTKQAVVACVEATVKPIVSTLQAEMLQVTDAMNVYSKVMALSQENTPESRIAILNLLSSIRLSDTATIDDVKAYVQNAIDAQNKAYQDVLNSIADIKKDKAEFVEESTVEEKPVIEEEGPAIVEEESTIAEEPASDVDDGTQI